MKKIITTAALLVLLGVMCWLLIPPIAQSAKAETATTTPAVVTPTLSPAQIIWFAHLMQCESGIRKTAVNPVDRDGTASIGLLQFKQGTFDYYTKQYGILGDILDGTSQVSIVQYWILHPGTVDWTWQFPDCVKKYGAPPK